MEKKPKLKRDWEGRKVRTLRNLQNRVEGIPAGTVLTVITNRGGLSLTSDPCTCCGIKVFIRGVPEFDVELIPKE